jgi:hypothetical protein
MFLGLRRLLNGWSLVRIRPGANKIKYFFDNENRLGQHSGPQDAGLAIEYYNVHAVPFSRQAT